MRKFYIAMIVLECIGCIVSFSDGGFSNIVYYTVLSNVLALVISVLSLLNPDSKSLSLWRYICVVCLTLTCLIVFAVLVPMSIPYGTQWDLIVKGPQLFHHVLCPLLFLYAFCFADKGYQISSRDKKAAALPTFMYGSVLMICNGLYLIHGPYPFLYVHEQSLLASILWFVLIVVTAYGIAVFVAKLHNKAQNI